MHSKNNNADLPTDLAELVLVELPNGQAAWLRPERDDDPRYVLTSRGRAAVHARPAPSSRDGQRRRRQSRLHVFVAAVGNSQLPF
jgi:hypothetical protein